MSLLSVSSSSSTSYNRHDENDSSSEQILADNKVNSNEAAARSSVCSNGSLGDATSGNSFPANNPVRAAAAKVNADLECASDSSSNSSSVRARSPTNYRQSASIPILSMARHTPPSDGVKQPQRRTVQIVDGNDGGASAENNNLNSSKFANIWDSRSSTPPTVDSFDVEQIMRSHSSASMSHLPRTFHFDQQQQQQNVEEEKSPFVRISSSWSPSANALRATTNDIDSGPDEKDAKSEISSSGHVPVQQQNSSNLHVPATFGGQFRKRSVSGAHDVIVAAFIENNANSEAATGGSAFASAEGREITAAPVVVPESYANPISCEAPADLAANEQIPPALSGKTSDEEDLKDPWCDPEKPRKISFADVAAAAVRIRAIPVTSCQRSHFIADVTGIDVYLKKEIENYTGSFKERGVRNALLNLSEAQRRKGVVAASAGNHALGLCHHGKLLGVPVTVVMPTVAPLMKVSLCEALGGNIIIIGSDVVESKKHAMRIARDRGLMYLNGYDHPDVLAGQGSIGIELLAQVPDCDAVIVPVGGGGLICGIATAVKALNPDIKVIGVQSNRACAFTFSMREGYAVSCPVKATLADGLAVSKPGVNSVHSSIGLIDKMILVSEDYIALAILRLLEWEKLVAEGAGAIGLAAVFSGQLDEFKGKKVAIIISGGNIDTTVLGRCIERGLAVDGRLCRFTVTVPDRPGSICGLTQCIASVGVSIKDIVHERAWLKSDIFSVQVTCTVETRNATHAQQLESVLREKYDRVVFPKTWIDIDDTSFGLQLSNNGASSAATKAIEA